jgi:hypothetical protein
MPNAELPVRLDIGQATDQEKEFLRVLESRIVGQVSGKRAAARAFRRALNQLKDGRGPIYKLLQIGKSRTGKTLTAETAALAMHGDSEALVFIDCESYKQSHQIQQLLGAPPSYVGYKDPKDQKTGQPDPSALFARVNLIASRKGSKVPVTIVLLDEIEKASDEFLDVLLGIFDKGKIRLANNTETDFTDCIFFMTSNLAMDKVERLDKPFGFRMQGKQAVTEMDIRAIVTGELKLRFKPEFLKRVNETVIFAPLTAEQLEQVVDLEVKLLKERIRARLPRPQRFSLDVQKSAREFVLERALSDNGGVAEIKNVLETYCADLLGNELAKGTIAGGDLVIVSREDGEDRLCFKLMRGLANPGELVDLDKPLVGERPAAKGEALSALDAFVKIKALCIEKLVQTAPQRSYNEGTISIGVELRKLVQQMGYPATKWEEIHAPLFESKAYELFWQKISNSYWYWRLLQESLNQSTSLPIKEQAVRKAIDRLRAQEGVAKDYRLDNPTIAARLTVKGVMLITINPETHEEYLAVNRIFS